jgi:hypothetical protein
MRALSVAWMAALGWKLTYVLSAQGKFSARWTHSAFPGMAWHFDKNGALT